MASVDASGIVGRWPDVGRQREVVDAAPLGGAELAQPGAQPAELRRIVAGVVPVVGVARHERQQATFALAAEHDRRVRLLHRLRFAPRVTELEVVPVERRRRLGQQRPDDGQRLLEAVESLGDGAQLDPVGRALRLEPAGTDAELEAPARRDVDRDRHVGQHRRVAIRDAGHHHATTEPARAGEQHRQTRPALQRRLLGPGAQRIEVVVDPSGAEHVEPVGDVPQLGQLRPRAVRLGRGEGEAHAG